MNTLIYIGIGILWAIFGSFWSVLTSRMEKWTSRKTIQSILIGRSRCDKDQTPLKRNQLIPIRSYIHNKGRCRQCGHKLPSWYTWLEIGSALIFVLTYHLLTHYTTASTISIAARIILNRLLLTIAIYDARTQILHMPLRYLSCIPTIFIIHIHNTRKESLISAILYIGITTLVYRAAKRYAQKKHQQSEGLGQGDIYVMGTIGAIVPVLRTYQHITIENITTIINSYLRILIVASIISLCHRGLAHKQISRKKTDTQIAFIPGLVLWLWIVTITAPYRQQQIAP